MAEDEAIADEDAIAEDDEVSAAGAAADSAATADESAEAALFFLQAVRPRAATAARVRARVAEVFMGCSLEAFTGGTTAARPAEVYQLEETDQVPVMNP